MNKVGSQSSKDEIIEAYNKSKKYTGTLCKVYMSRFKEVDKPRFYGRETYSYGRIKKVVLIKENGEPVGMKYLLDPLVGKIKDKAIFKRLYFKNVEFTREPTLHERECLNVSNDIDWTLFQRNSASRDYDECLSTRSLF